MPFRKTRTVPRNDLIQVRRDIASDWTYNNPTLASGEVGFETDTGKVKIGTGSMDWVSLPYVTDASDITGVISSARISGSYTGITGIGTLTVGTIPASLLTGNINTARISGSYTGITGVGTLTVGSIPTSLLTGTTLPATIVSSSLTSVGTLANLTVTNAINGTLTKTVTGTNTADLIYGNMADNDQFRIRIGGTASNAGYVEIATADDGTEPIYVRQYTGIFTTLTRTATILDGSGNTSFPGTVTASAFSGNASTATNLSTNRDNWGTNGTISAVVGQLAWKNYGNSHTIFDASQSTSPSGGAVNNTNAAIAWSGTYPTLMGWNGANTYGVRVDSARTSDNTTGNAATATTATNVSGGTISGVSLVSVTRNQSSSQHGQQGVQVLSNGEVAGLSFWLTSYAMAPVLRVWQQNGEGIDCGNNAGTGYVFLGASTFTTRCSAQWKDDIREKNDSEILNDTLAVLSIPVVKFNDKYGEPIQDGDTMVSVETSNLSDEEKQNPLQMNHIDREGFIAETVAKLFPKASMFDINGNANGTDMGVITAQLLDAVKLLVLQGEEFSQRLSLLEGS